MPPVGVYLCLVPFTSGFWGPVSVGSQYIIPQPPHSTSINDGTPWLNVHQPDTNYVGVDHGSNYAVYGQHHYDLYHDDLWYGSEGPPSAANLVRQDAYQTNPNLDIGHLNTCPSLLVHPT
ncbi:hypothetical protein V8E53_009114 [Lactarius tabidus]